MLYRIADIINKWDPMNLFPLVPDEEYMDEIHMIYRVACETDEAMVLGMKIRNILVEHFGYEIDITIQDCIDVAEDILKTKKNSY